MISNIGLDHTPLLTRGPLTWNSAFIIHRSSFIIKCTPLLTRGLPHSGVGPRHLSLATRRSPS